jgi:3-hydroxy-5-phosphonooxypentane-2,4-dione thiolase
MPDVDGLETAVISPALESFARKSTLAADAYDWGMQHRLARIFPRGGPTVMLAIDHGYFQGPTTGLERLDLVAEQLVDHADALMLTRGALRSSVAPTITAPLVLRASGGPSVLKELSDEHRALTVEDALRLHASALAIQVFIGGEHESRSVANMSSLVDDGLRYGLPVLAVTAVGRELTRDARYLGLATRICAELGAQVVKTYYCEEGFETVTRSCPVPIVIAGGKKVPEGEALNMAYRAIAEGAAGVDMGRNIFQSTHPVAMIQAVRSLIHDRTSAREALQLFEDLSLELDQTATTG